MAIYKGLNVSLYLGDVDNLTQSLSNLGLEINDLERIRGLGTNITRSELHLLSGLDLDQEKESYSLFRSANVLTNEMLAVQDISRALNFNIRIDEQLRAGAIKYNFLEYGENGATDLKSADISTSRVSSWSKIGTGPIFYGANLEINPSDGIGGYGDNNKSVIKIEDLVIEGDISPKRFDAEETTDLITININGVDKEFYAMRSIPTSFFGFFRSANFKYEVVAGISTANPTIVFADLSQDPPIELPFTGANSADTIAFDVTRSTDRRIDFYYRPDGLQLLDLQNIRMLEFPNAVFSNIKSINIRDNDLSDMPDFVNISGANIPGNVAQLEVVNVIGNGLNRSIDTANTQLHRLPSSVKELYINGTFSDSETIDIRTLPSKDGSVSAEVASELERLDFDAYYNRYSARQMTDTGVSPEVSQSSIRSYRVQRHPYTTIAYSITQSTSLQTLDFYNCNINYAAANYGTTSGRTREITLNSPVLSSIQLGYNNANVIDVSGKTALSSYYHYRNWGGGSNNIDGYFNGCNSLNTLYLYHTYCTGTLNTAFANLPNLRNLHLYNTRLSGNMHPTTFSGTTSLYYFNVSHGLYNTQANDASNFFGNAVVDELNEVPSEIGVQYGGGFYAGLMENSATDTPYSDAYPRPANEEYYLIVSDAQDEIVGASATVRNHCNNLNSGGFTDWDMPTRNELELMYRNLKPDTTPNNTNHPGSNPDSVPSFNRDYTSNSPGRTNLSIFQAGSSQAFTIPSNQNYAAGSTIGVGGWQTYSGASASVNGNRIVVEQGFLGSNGGIYKILSDLPDGMYIASVRVRYEGGNGNGDDLEISARTNSNGGGISRGGITVTNLDDNSPSDVTFEIEKRSGEILNLTFECEDLDFSIENWSVVSKGAFYWSAEEPSGTTGVQNMQNGEQDSTGGLGIYRVRPIRRVPVRTGIQIEQQGTSNTLQPVGESLGYFHVMYNRGIRGKLPNVGYLNNLRRFYLLSTGITGTFPDFSFAKKIYDIYVYNNYLSGTFELRNSNVSRVRFYNNNFTAMGAIDCPRMWDFHGANNPMTGDFPDLSKCSYLHDIYLYNCNFTNYVAGSLGSNRYLRKLYIYNNNNFTLGDLFRLLVDLKASYDSRPRSNFQCNASGIPAWSEQVLVTYPEYYGIYEFLKSKGWTIIINP